MTTTTPGAARGYEALAPFYDAFTAASDYETWTSHVVKLAEEHGLDGTRLLDVACGTGNSFQPFLDRGFDVTGCDASPEMLAEAARKAPGVRLVEADMRHLPALGCFDLVVCFDDSLNHLLSEDELASALASMAGNLEPQGLLLFDLNTLLAYRTTFATDSVSVRDGTTFVWHGDCSPDSPPGCQAAARIDVFDRRSDGLYTRLTTRHPQRHFPPHRVTALLAGARLECVGVYGVLYDGSHVTEVDETRHLKAMYAAQPAKGGDQG
ncbi:MAG: class I SAM-dependent methyltransferase [Thermoleophilaceae bacterium]|nr:class I SAM-dependent methyltransferase [Thermoleophilaceae bacterium]